MMKRFLIFLTLMAFFVAAPLAMAQDTTKKETPKKIKCCVKGKCSSKTEKDCTKKKGQVVQDCSECKKQ